MKAIAWFWVFCMYGLNMSVAQALTPQQVRDIVTGETDARIESLQKVLAQADAQTTVFLQALADDAVVIAEEQVVIVREGKPCHVLGLFATALQTQYLGDFCGDVWYCGCALCTASRHHQPE